MEEIPEIPYTQDDFTVRRQYWLSKKWDNEAASVYSRFWYILRAFENDNQEEASPV